MCDLNHTHRPLVEQCCLMFLHDKDSPATLDHYGQTVDDQIVLLKLQQPTRLSLQRRLCDDAFAPLARQVCWHVRSKPHTQTVGRAMLSHVSTWQRFTCHYCLAKLQQPTRLSLQRRLCDDGSKPHTQTVGRAMLSHVSTWQRFTCNYWSLWTDCGRSNCLAKLQQPTRLSLQSRLCDDAFAPLARQVCWHVRSKPHTQTVGRAMLSHVSTWQRFTCHYCFAKLQLPSRLSLTRNGSLKWSVGNWIPSHAIRLEPMT